MPTQAKPNLSRNAAATVAINKVVCTTTAASLDAIDREICSQPNCAKCRNRPKLAAKWKPRVGLLDVYSEED